MSDSMARYREATILQTLRRCRLFADASSALLHRIAAISTLKSLSPGEFLFREGEAVQGFYIVQKGAIKVCRVNPRGREQLIHIFRAEEALATESLVSEFGHPADALALEPACVLLVRRSRFLALLKHRPELALGVLRSMNQFLHILVRLLDDLTLKDVKTRLAGWLLQQCPNPHSREPYRIELSIPKRMLAAELGIVSETFSRAVAKFRDQKLLAVQGNTVILLCPRQLTDLVQRQTSRRSLSALAGSWGN